MAIDGPLDGRLHLLDRQLVDSEGLLAGKVDEVELTEYDDGLLAVTALLAGATALLPRLGVRTVRRAPVRIVLDHVTRLGSDVRLDVGRDALAQSVDQGDTRRLGDLLDADVIGPGGTPLGRVLDARLEPEHLPEARLRVTALVVGRGRPGSMLGYDRRGDQGPWLVARLVRALHRHSGLVPFEAVTAVEWDGPRVTVDRPLEPLEAAR